jgi:GR25 family glycosyltransferase involved in LPS biosynthesis
VTENNPVSDYYSAYVLSLRSRFRGQELVEFLGCLNFRHKLVWGFETAEFAPDFFENLVDQRKAKFLLGRELSFPEVSCALGHFEMYEEFLSSNSEWGLFLEDDSGLKSNIESLLNNLVTVSEPIVLTLSSMSQKTFGPQPFPLDGHPNPLSWMPGFQKCLIPPTGAFAYLLNRKSAQIAVHTLRGKKIYCPADFPFEFRNLVQFYASREVFVDYEEKDGQSTIEPDRVRTYKITSPKSSLGNFQRRLRVVFDYCGLGIAWAKHIGLSGRLYRKEKILQRRRYKKFLSDPLSEF